MTALPLTLAAPRLSRAAAPKPALPLTASATAQFGLWTLDFGLRPSSPVRGRGDLKQPKPIRSNPNLKKNFFPVPWPLDLPPLRLTATNFDH